MWLGACKDKHLSVEPASCAEVCLTLVRRSLTSCTMDSSAALSSSVQEPVPAAEEAPVPPHTPPPSAVPLLWPLVESLLVPVQAELALLRAVRCWCCSRSCSVGDFALPTPPAEVASGASRTLHHSNQRASEAGRNVKRLEEQSKHTLHTQRILGGQTRHRATLGAAVWRCPWWRAWQRGKLAAELWRQEGGVRSGHIALQQRRLVGLRLVLHSLQVR